MTVGGDTVDFEYDSDGDTVDDSDLMTKIGDDSLGWNANGNLDNSVAAAFVYDWDNKLKYAVGGENAVEIRYDPRGNRIYKGVYDTQGNIVKERKYIVDIVGKLPVILCEIDPNTSSLINAYIYANSQILAQDAYNSTEPNSTEFDRYYYLPDRLGSIRQIVDCNALTVATYTFNPYGEDFATECDETIYNPFKYTGQWYDAEIAQYYLRARQYDPKLMRFSGRDPVKGKYAEPMTLHKYLYCANDSVNRVDLTGKDFNMVSTVSNMGTGMTMNSMSASAMSYGGSWGARFAGQVYMESLFKAVVVAVTVEVGIDALVSGRRRNGDQLYQNMLGITNGYSNQANSNNGNSPQIPPSFGKLARVAVYVTVLMEGAHNMPELIRCLSEIISDIFCPEGPERGDNEAPVISPTP